MKTNKILKTVALLGVTTFLTSSCEDWLTIYPQDRVVEENFWEDKSDLEGVRYAAYKNMLTTVPKLVLWGDLRSDAYVLNPVEPQGGDEKQTYLRYKKIIQAQPDSSMSEFDWAGVYTTINFCNKVLAHGPEVLKKDKQFTTAEWRQIKAEMTALRSLNYFYLLRAFKDVPYTTKVINTDAEIVYDSARFQLDVLDSCIYAIEGSKAIPGSGIDIERMNIRFPNKRDTKGLITRPAVYAMLADMYLWRASLHEGRWDLKHESYILPDSTVHTPATDYEKAQYYADEALRCLASQNAAEDKLYTTSNNIILEDQLASEVTSKANTPFCQMISNNFRSSSATARTLELPVFEQMYTNGNCRESIFELQYSSSDGTENTIVNSLYTPGSNTQLASCRDAVNAAYQAVDGIQMCDTRYWVNCYDRLFRLENESFGVQLQSKPGPAPYGIKYANPQPHFREGNDREMTMAYLVSNRRNFIIYRMADMMLIKAEAILANPTKTATRAHAYALCQAVRRRNYCQYKDDVPAYSPVLSDLKNFNAPENDTIVMNERLIEFMGEGKRWFDLVRYAERKAKAKVTGGTVVTDKDEREKYRDNTIMDGANGVYIMATAFLQKSQSTFYKNLITRMKNRYGLYSPIYEFEVKGSNGMIKQNPVWNKSKYDM